MHTHKDKKQKDCTKDNEEDCSTNELPVPGKFVKPLYDAGHKDYHDLKISTTAKTPKRIPIAHKGDTDPKPAKGAVEVPAKPKNLA